MKNQNRTRDVPSRGCLIAIAALLVVTIVAAPVWWIYVGRDAGFDRDLDLAKARFRQGSTKGLRDDLLDLHAMSPADPDVITLLAELAEQRQRPDEAIKWYRQVPQASPERAAWARFRAAEIAMQRADLDMTETLAEETLRLDGSIADARRLVMRIHHVLLRTGALRHQVRQLDLRGQLTVEDAAYYCLGPRMTWNDDARVWLEQCLEHNPDHNGVRAALIRLNRRSNQEAVVETLFRTAPPDGPEFWRLEFERAEQLEVSGDDRAAEQVLARLPPDADADSRVWLARGRVWSNLGDAQAACAALANAAALDPYDPAATIALARVLRHAGQAVEADRLDERSQQQHQLQEAIRLVMKAIEEGGSADDWPQEQLELAAQLVQTLGLPREHNIFQRAAQLGNVLPIAAASLDANGRRTELASATLDDVTEIAMSEAVGPDAVVFAAGPRVVADNDHKIRLTEIAAKIGLTFAYETGRSPSRWLMETLGGGVGAFDYDLDGWPDLFFSQGNTLPVGAVADGQSNVLFQNQHGERVADVTMPAGLTHAGYGHGCAVGDLDNDGFPDLVVCNYGSVIVYQNQGDGTFGDMTAACGVASSAWSTSAVFHDLDRDGDLDLYIANYVQAPFDSLVPCKSQGKFVACHPSTLAAEQDSFWENMGDGRFRDRTRDAGVTTGHGKGLGLMVADFDQDGQSSIFVANDSTPNSLFAWSPSSGPASMGQDVAFSRGVAVNEEGASEACMGVACGDVDNDGRFDLFVTNFDGETNTLYRNSMDHTFVDVTRRAGLANAGRDKLGFGCQLIDFDADGWLDLFVANGHLHEVAQHPQLFVNQGGLRFRDGSQGAGDFFRRPRLGRSVAVIDVDCDLLADLVVTYQEGNASLLRNESAAGNRLALNLVGIASNRDAVEAVVRVTIGDSQRTFRVDRCGGYMAANQPTVFVGCGDSKLAEQVSVTWPSGHVDQWVNLPTGKSYLIREGNRDLLIQHRGADQ